MKVLFIFICIIGYLIANSLLIRSVKQFGSKRNIATVRVEYVARTVKLGVFTAFIILLCLALGLGYGEVSVFVSSVFAVIGVALFAQWSILSNLTASIIIFFSFPYRVGDRVRVVEADEDLSGVIEDIGLYHVLIRKTNGDLITYPNSLILQKAVVKLADSESPATDAVPAVAETDGVSSSP